MAEENDAQEENVEAEMLRMMQEEWAGEEGAAGGGAAGGDDDEGGDDDAGGANIDSMLEEEMLKAMEDEAGGGGTDALAAFTPQSAIDPGVDTEGIDRLTDVDVEITVEIGENKISIQEIMTWSAGSVIELTPEEGEPVKVLLNGTQFARGEIVVVGDTFGVRIIDLIDPPDQATH